MKGTSPLPLVLGLVTLATAAIGCETKDVIEEEVDTIGSVEQELPDCKCVGYYECSTDGYQYWFVQGNAPSYPCGAPTSPEARDSCEADCFRLVCIGDPIGDPTCWWEDGVCTKSRWFCDRP